MKKLQTPKKHSTIDHDNPFERVYAAPKYDQMKGESDFENKLGSIPQKRRGSKYSQGMKSNDGYHPMKNNLGKDSSRKSLISNPFAV